jgi:hypothetical protein
MSDQATPKLLPKSANGSGEDVRAENVKLRRDLELIRQNLQTTNFILEQLQRVFLEFGVGAQAKNAEEAAESLRTYLNDAVNLYQVMRGEMRASDLLANVERLVPPENFYAITVDLAEFLAPRLQKFVHELADGSVKFRPAIAAAMLSTAVKRWDEFRPIFERRMLTAQHLERRLNELFDHGNVTDSDDRQSIAHNIARAIGDDLQLLGQLESGDFSEVERLFAMHAKQRQTAVQ